MFSERVAKLLDAHKAVGYEKIAVDSTGVQVLTPTVVTEPTDRPYYALVTVVLDATATVTTNALHMRLDGTAPTGADGMPLGQGGFIMLEGYDQIRSFKVIATEAGKTHSLRVQYFRLGK